MNPVIKLEGEQEYVSTPDSPGPEFRRAAAILQVFQETYRQHAFGFPQVAAVDKVSCRTGTNMFCRPYKTCFVAAYSLLVGLTRNVSGNPFSHRIIPDSDYILLRPFGNNIASHRYLCFAFNSARKDFLSKSTTSELDSPSSIAARSAANLASSSSRRRSAARTTSLVLLNLPDVIAD